MCSTTIWTNYNGYLQPKDITSLMYTSKCSLLLSKWTHASSRLPSHTRNTCSCQAFQFQWNTHDLEVVFSVPPDGQSNQRIVPLKLKSTSVISCFKAFLPLWYGLTLLRYFWFQGVLTMADWLMWGRPASKKMASGRCNNKNPNTLATIEVRVIPL